MLLIFNVFIVLQQNTLQASKQPYKISFQSFMYLVITKGENGGRV